MITGRRIIVVCVLCVAGLFPRGGFVLASDQRETAVFAAGCFWGVEHTFRSLPGIISARVGYTGGAVPDPSYERVCSGTTGHAEAVELVYDPRILSYERLLSVFWECHDPTTRNRQGPDIGSQYRSAIFYHSPGQKAAAEASRDALNRSGRYSRPVVTQILPAGPFYPAEEYHQRYYEKNGRGSCRI